MRLPYWLVSAGGGGGGGGGGPGGGGGGGGVWGGGGRGGGGGAGGWEGGAGASNTRCSCWLTDAQSARVTPARSDPDSCIFSINTRNILPLLTYSKSASPYPSPPTVRSSKDSSAFTTTRNSQV